MIHKINYLFTRLFDILLFPFSFLPDFWGVLFLSVLMSFVVLAIYRLISSPARIKAAKEKVKANILAIRIYRDFWKVILVSFFKSLYYTGKYFALNVIPVLVILPILFPVFVQMDIRYGMRPFHTGETVLVRAAFSGDPSAHSVELVPGKTFKTMMNPVFINAWEDDAKQIPLREVNWKLGITASGVSPLQLKVDGQLVEKSLVTGYYSGALSNRKAAASSWSHFLEPAEALIPGNSAVTSISLKYPPRDVSFLGIHTHWLVYNLILVVVIVLALHKRFGIEF